MSSQLHAMLVFSAKIEIFLYKGKRSMNIGRQLGPSEVLGNNLGWND